MLRIGESLVGEGKLSREQLNKALGVQQQLGNRLGTVLLELGFIDEASLLESLGRQRSTRTVSKSQLAAVPTSVVRMIPAKLAARYGMVPFELKGRTLFVASRDIGDALKEDEVGFLTSCMVRTCIGLEVRIFEALERHYRVSCPARHQALAQRLAGKSKPAPRARPQPAAESDHTSAPGPRPRSLASQHSSALRPRPVGSSEVATTSPAAPAARPTPAPAPPPPKRFIELDAEDAALLGLSASESPSGWSPAADEPVLLEPTPLPWLRREPSATPDGVPVEGAEEAVAGLETGTGPARVEAATEIVPGAAPGNGVGTVAHSALTHPLTEGDARQPADEEERLLAAASELKNAEIRDDIADVLLAFAAPYFRRRLLLIARKETIVGWRGEGQGIERDRVRAISIPVAEPSVFLGLRGADSFWLGALPPIGFNQALVDGLGGVSPKDCAVLPVTLRSRVVCYLYGDNLEAGVTGAPLAELRRLTAKAGLAFEVYILKNKIRIA